GLTQFEQPACAVVAHAGHDDTGGEWASGLGHRPEQDLDAGTVAADRRTVDQLDPVAAARSADQAVRVTRNDQGPAGAYRIVMPGLGDLDFDARVAVEPLGESRREIGRHVLNDHDAWTSDRKTGQELLDCLHATRAHAHRDDSLAGAAARRIGHPRYDHVGGM